MALIKCPECQKEISDKAKQCIYCGYPLDDILDDKTNGTVDLLSKKHPDFLKKNWRRIKGFA